MATYAPVAYTTAASNTQIDFDITFTFLRATDVVVSVIDPNGNVLVNGTDYDAELQAVNDGTFDMRIVQAGTLTTTQDPLAANHVISLKRNTDVSQIVTVFQDGASFKAADINAIITQLFNKIQEVEVSSGEGIGLTDDLVAFDAENKPLRNLGTPTAANDAMRKVDIDSGIGPDITTVAGIAADVTTVASGTDTSGRLHRLNIEDVADDLNLGENSDITTVATDIRTGGNNHVQAVSNSIANVDTLAGNDTDGTAHLVNIETVAEDLALGTSSTIKKTSDSIANVNQVGNSIADVNTLAGNDTDGTAHLVNIETVAEDLALLSSSKVKIVADNLSGTNTIQTVADIESDITTLAPQASNIGTLTQAANLTALQNAQANAQAAQAALNQLNNKYHGSFTNVNNDDAEVEADIEGDANLTLEAGDLYFDTTNSKLRYYDGSNWYNAAAAQVINTTNLSNVGDVNAYASLTTDDFLKYDGAGWQNVNPAAVRQAINVEDGATADQTGAEIKAAYELEANAFTDAQFTKLSNISANADVTADAGAVMETDTTTTAMQFVVDEDDMVSDSATKVPTQQSVKAYADTKQANITTSSGTINAQSLTTYVAGDSGSVSVDVRKANPRTTTGTHTLLGGATMYYANAAATYDTANLTPGDIVTIYNEGGGAVTVNTGGTVSLFKDGEASAVTAAVTIGADTIATVTCVSATKAIIAGSDLT